MSNKKTGKEILLLIIGGCIRGLFVLGGEVIGNWGTFFSPSPSLKSAEGTWKVVEKLKSEQDNSVIDWKYKASIINPMTLHLEGKKVKVNDKKLTSEEESVTSAYKLIFNTYKAE